MPGDKTNKPRTIAQKYSLDYYRRSLATRAWKPRWNYAALLLAVIGLAALYAYRRNAAFQAAPVSTAHASFGTRCELCHDQSWQAGKRLFTFTSAVHSVSNVSCQACHRASDHVKDLVPAATCVTCHQEHRPDGQLIQVADSDCTRCHEKLALENGAANSYYREIKQFAAGSAAHPEFAVLRSVPDDVGPRHGATCVAIFVAGKAGDGKWLDRGGLKFNHHVHLNPEGVVDPEGHKTVLTCSVCHQPESDGNLMQPIQYELHCARCHPLRLSGPLSSLGALPHSSVEEVRGVIRDRLSRELAKSPQHESSPPAEQPRPESKTTLPRLPLLPAPAELSDEEGQQFNTELAAADHAVFGLEAKGMCRKCHYLEARGDDWHVFITNPLIAGNQPSDADARPAMVPRRWLQSANFDHASHRAVECKDCHAAEPSKETSDILLPSIDTCRKCHSANATAVSTPVRSDCVFCHTYHAAGLSIPGIPLEQLLAPPTTAAIPATNR
ncbi:MAG TPA: cytochrome c3 family protein [Lacipirellulaceae bacterium]|jgi:hypothetical protein